MLRTIRDRERDGAITNTHIEWTKEDSIQYAATRNTFNGSYWECYLYHKELSKEFSKRRTL